MSDTVAPIPYGNFYDPPPTASTKDPWDKCGYMFNFSAELLNEPGDYLTSISQVTFSPGNGVLPDLAPNGSAVIGPDPCTGIANQSVYVPTQGGVECIVYTISVYVVTFQGNAFKRSIFVPVNNL